MTLRNCSHEGETKQLLELGHWPHSCSQEQREHVAGCRSCGDLVLLTTTFRTARAQSTQAAQPPPASVVWWRAQLRRRNAAVTRMQRPLWGAQVFAFAMTVLILVGVLGYAEAHGLHWLSGFASWLSSLGQSSAFHFEVLWPFLAHPPSVSYSYLVSGAVMLVLFGGVALYLASEKQ